MLDTVSKVGLGSKITVLNPVGYPPKITKKTAAPRLESLDGKTFGVVGPGKIGRETGRLAEAFGARAVFAGRHDPLPEFLAAPASQTSQIALGGG